MRLASEPAPRGDRPARAAVGGHDLSLEGVTGSGGFHGNFGRSQLKSSRVIIFPGSER